MLFETCWFYLKKYEIKKYTEHKDCYSLFFNFNPFQTNVPQNLKDFSVLVAHVETSQVCRGHRLSRNFGSWVNVFVRLDTVVILYQYRCYKVMRCSG